MATRSERFVAEIEDAKDNLTSLIERAAAGEEILIAMKGTPVARLVAVPPPVRGPRVSGRLKGKMWVADDIDSVDDEITRMFEGEYETDSDTGKP